MKICPIKCPSDKPASEKPEKNKTLVQKRENIMTIDLLYFYVYEEKIMLNNLENLKETNIFKFESSKNTDHVENLH